MNLLGTRTEENLRNAFAVETQAMAKYQYYAEKAKSEGMESIYKIYNEIANNEKAHGKIWFKLLHNSEVPTTIENLNDSANGEHTEWATMYKDYAEIAKEEGFVQIAELFKGVSIIEKQHEDKYKELYTQVENNTVYSKEKIVDWKCENCGHTQKSESAPDKCPVCSHPKGWFSVTTSN